MERRAIQVRGIVQGVGFRPFVHRLAARYGLSGFVRNEAGAVAIEVEGDNQTLDRFQADVRRHAPPLAQIEELRWEPRPARGDAGFRIEPSSIDSAETIRHAPDIAVCDDCLRELFDPFDRRYEHAFISCTNCGPRFTIIKAAPYDRARTTMASFPMCPLCSAEYHDPANRRYHAEPISCPACGPRLALLDALGAPLGDRDPVAAAVDALRSGRIGAVKGLGGYHLACLASEDSAVRELRRRKARDEKPLAVMVADIAAARELAVFDEREAALLASPARPIVVVRRRERAPLAESISPANRTVGLMLPYTPLHHLLLRSIAAPLVMTSGNRSDEPIAYADADALERLSGIADFFLVHDRPIEIRCDDSVTRMLDGKEATIRRSRGLAPLPIRLPFSCPRPILALGGQFKSAFALGRNRSAIVSHHIGDLDHYEAERSLADAIAHYERLFGISPDILVHDLHPDYSSTRYALNRLGPTRMAVQHHAAHAASCMAEHGLNQPVIAVVFDGTGYGLDGAVWGGEFLVGDYASFRRFAHLRYVPMPGGEQAIKEPWRMALAHLADAGRLFSPSWSEVPQSAQRFVLRLLERGFAAPVTSSAGRLFDAAAAIAGVRTRVGFEAQAAIELEAMACDTPEAGAYPFEIVPGASLVVDTRPLIAALARDVERNIETRIVARRFHTTIVEIIAEVCLIAAETAGRDVVVLSGGVFMNAIIATEAEARLRAAGLRVFRNQVIPANDGGLCLGQLAIAAACAATVES